MPSYHRPEGAEGITSSGRRGPRGPAIGAGRRRTRGRGPDQPGAPSERRRTVAAAGQRGVGPRRGVATRTQASRSVVGSTTRVPSGTNPTTTSRIPAGTPARSRIPPAARVRSPGQGSSAAVGSAASAGGVDKVRARIRGEAPRNSPTILGPVHAGPGATPIATSPTASAGTIDTVAGVGAGGRGGFATGAVLAPGPPGAAPAWAAPTGAAPAAARSASRRSGTASGVTVARPATDASNRLTEGTLRPMAPGSPESRRTTTAVPDGAGNRTVSAPPGARLAASGRAISWAAAPDAARGRLHASTRVGVPSAAAAGMTVCPTLRMVPTSPPAGGPGAAGCANATGVVKATVVARPAVATAGSGSTPTEIALSVAATTRTASERIGRASVGGRSDPSESRATRSRRQDPGRLGADTARLTICPARVALATSDHAAATGAAGALESPSARATGVHRTANRIASGRPSVRVVHGSATTIREPTRTGALADGATTRGTPNWRPRSRSVTIR